MLFASYLLNILLLRMIQAKRAFVTRENGFEIYRVSQKKVPFYLFSFLVTLIRLKNKLLTFPAPQNSPLVLKSGFSVRGLLPVGSFWLQFGFIKSAKTQELAFLFSSRVADCGPQALWLTAYVESMYICQVFLICKVVFELKEKYRVYQKKGNHLNSKILIDIVLSTIQLNC